MQNRLRQLSMNERRLIELVFRHGQIARVGLTQATDMTGASITRLIAGLELLGLFEQKTDKSGTRGQPKRLLSLRKNKFFSVGIYIYLNKVSGVLLDLSGTVHATQEKKLDTTNAIEIAAAAHDITQELLQQTSTNPAQFLGTGLSVPGNFGTYQNLVQAHEMFPELNGPAIFEAMKKNGPHPVFLENDGTASALGEYLFGGHKRANPLFLIHVGYGLGGGAVLNGRPFRGANGNACLPGSLFPYDQPRPTLQDLQACLAKEDLNYENVFSGKAGPIMGIPVLSEWVQRAAIQLEFAIKVISGMFDPEIIVLGGALPTAIMELIVKILETKTLEGPSRGLSASPVTATSLGDLSGPIGAASIPFFATFFPGSTMERGNGYLNGRSVKVN